MQQEKNIVCNYIIILEKQSVNKTSLLLLGKDDVFFNHDRDCSGDSDGFNL